MSCTGAACEGAGPAGCDVRPWGPGAESMLGGLSGEAYVGPGGCPAVKASPGVWSEEPALPGRRLIQGAEVRVLGSHDGREARPGGAAGVRTLLGTGPWKVGASAGRRAQRSEGERQGSARKNCRI